MTGSQVLPPPESTYQLLLDAARAWPDGIAAQWINLSVADEYPHVQPGRGMWPCTAKRKAAAPLLLAPPEMMKASNRLVCA
jgi:hypothetical protein